jgi:hypothetical protein
MKSAIEICKETLPYSTARDAYAWRQRIRKPWLTVFRCGVCAFWHLGQPPRNHRQSRNRRDTARPTRVASPTTQKG